MRGSENCDAEPVKGCVGRESIEGKWGFGREVQDTVIHHYFIRCLTSGSLIYLGALQLFDTGSTAFQSMLCFSH